MIFTVSLTHTSRATQEDTVEQSASHFNRTKPLPRTNRFQTLQFAKYIILAFLYLCYVSLQWSEQHNILRPIVLSTAECYLIAFCRDSMEQPLTR